MKKFIRVACLLPIALLLNGCGDGTFYDEDVAQFIQQVPVRLDGEQVVFSRQQIQCGEHKDLWILDKIGDSGAGIGRLEEAGRKLQFSDDVRVSDESSNEPPYAQMRGSVTLAVRNVIKITDDNPTTKTVELKVGVKLDHECFPDPLPLMGVRKGVFSATDNPRIQIKNKNGTWVPDRILH